MRMKGKDMSPSDIGRSLHHLADGGIAIFNRKGEITGLQRCAHALPLALRHLTGEYKTLGAARDQAEKAAHQRMAIAWRRQRLRAQFGVPRHDIP